MSSRSNGRNGARIKLQWSPSIAVGIISLGLLWPTSLGTSRMAEAKTPGKKYCFLGVCHRVDTLEETRRAIGRNLVLKASHYDDPKKDRFNPSNLTSSGEWFRSGEPDNAASPKLPNGTIVLAWNPATKKAAVLRINNAGPYWGKRTMDVSRGAAEKLGFARQGVATLHTRIVAAPTKAEATYSKGRRYSPVPGYLGAFESIDHALLETGRSIHRLISPPVHAIAGRDPLPVYPREQRPTAPTTVVADARRKPSKKEIAAQRMAMAKAVPAPQAPAAVIAAPEPKPTLAMAAISTATLSAVASAAPAPTAEIVAAAPTVAAKQVVARRTASMPARAKAAPHVKVAEVKSAKAAPARSKPLPPRQVAAKPATVRVAKVQAEGQNAARPVVRPTVRRPAGIAAVGQPVTASEAGYVSTDCQAWPRPCDFPSSRAGSSAASPAAGTRRASVAASSNRE